MNQELETSEPSFGESPRDDSKKIAASPAMTHHIRFTKLHRIAGKRGADKVNAHSGKGRTVGGTKVSSCKVILLGLGLAIATPRAMTAQIGVVAGYNRDLIEKFLPADGFDLTDSSNGFHVGVFFNFNLGLIGIRPAVIYHQVPNLVATAGTETTSFDIELVEVPLDLRLKIPVPVLRPYLLAAPVFTFPSSSVSGVNNQLGPRPVRVEFGAGFELDVGLRLWPEIRYGFGLQALMDSGIPVGDQTLVGEGNPRLNTFTLRLGVSF